jgi:SAM-dependent methyltransferase
MTTTELHGIYHELAFWQQFVKTERFLNGWVKKIKTPELHDEVAQFILSVRNDTVLDVGSGVVSILNGLVNVRAVDPLGDLYRLIFDYERHKVHPPMAFPAEELPFKNEYDIVHISNAIDHTQNPYKAYNSLFKAVKPGGYLIIQGFENEATHENWQGFHQNDIFVEEIWDDRKDYLLRLKREDELIETISECPYKLIQKTIGDKRWFIWIVKK